MKRDPRRPANRRLGPARKRSVPAKAAPKRSAKPVARPKSGKPKSRPASAAKAEAARLDRELLAAVLDAVPAVVTLRDRDGRYALVNTTGARRINTTPEAMIGRRPEDFYPPDEARQVLAADRAVFDSGRDAPPSEETFALVGQPTRWIVHRRPIRDAGGAASHVLSVGYDITERKRAEAALAASESRLHSLADTTPALLWMTDAEGRPLMQNQAWLDFHGAEAGDTTDGPWRDAMHPDDLPGLMATHRDAMARRAPYTAEYRSRRSDGAWRWLREMATPRVRSDGGFEGYTGVCIDITAERAAAAEARRGRELLQRIVDAIPATIALRDPDSRYVLANAAMLDFMPPGAAPVAGKTPGDLHDPDYAAKVLAYDREAFASGRPTRPVELTTAGPDGRDRHWLTQRVPIRDPDNGFDYVLSFTFDVTDLVETQREVQRTQMLLASILDSVPSGVSVRDRDGRYTLVNSAVARNFGATPEAMVGRRPEDFLLPDEARRALAADRAVFDSGRDAPIHEETFVLGGRPTHWIVHRRPIRDPGGAVTHVLSVGYEITERKRAEAALAASESRLRSLADTTPALLWMADAEGRPLMQNQAWLDFFGVDRDNVSDTVWQNAMHPDDRARVAAAHQDALARRVPYALEFRVRRKDGAWRLFEDFANPRFGPDGGFEGYTWAGVDVTERRELEDQLRQAAKLEAIGQLTGGIAHDFNNLLAVIIGHLDLADSANVDDEVRKLLAPALGAALRGAELTRRLLAFARRQPMDPRVTAVPALFDGIDELLRHTLGSNVAVTADVAADLPPVRVDATLFQTAILNLAINARDAMGSGGRLTVAARPESVAGQGHGLAPGDYVVVSVADTGSGMDRETLARACEPYLHHQGIRQGNRARAQPGLRLRAAVRRRARYRQRTRPGHDRPPLPAGRQGKASPRGKASVGAGLRPAPTNSVNLLGSRHGRAKSHDCPVWRSRNSALFSASWPA